jgi:hypothetical protein
MAVTALNKPDFRMIAKFRRRHLKALGDLFVQVPKLCRAAGLVKLGHVSLDGTKVQANASRHKAMSYGRMLRGGEEGRRGSGGVVCAGGGMRRDGRSRARRRAARRRDARLGSRQDGAVERIRAAKAALEAEAKAPPPPADDDGPGPSSG